MPVKIGTLLTNLAKKAGYDPNLIAVPAEAFDVPDELVAALDAKLLTEESAKNNPALKNYFRSQALDAIDQNIVALLDEFEFDEASANEITGIKNTYERLPALAKKIRDLEAQKAAAGKGDKAALQEQINRLNQEKAQLIADKDKEIQAMRGEAQTEITNFMFRNAITSVDLVTDQFDKETMLELAEQRIRKELQAQGAKAINKDGVLTLVQASDEALNFYKDNKAVTFNDFIDGVLANAKILKVTKTTTAGATGTQATNGNTSQTTTTQAAPVNNALLSKIDQAKAAYAKTGS
jgi:hypothetical protein